MKDKVKGLVAGLLIGSMVGGTAALAAGGQMIEVFYNIKDIRIDKVSKMPADGQKPFTLNGTTYVPLRFISENLGVLVAWDSATQTINLGESEQANEVYFGDGIRAMNFQREDTGAAVIYFRGSEVEQFESIGEVPRDNVGNTYDNYINMYSYGSALLEFPLNGQYKQFKSTFALTEAAKPFEAEGELEIYVDDQLKKTISIKPGIFPEEIDLDVKNANKIGFRLAKDTSTDDYVTIGLYNARLIK